MKSGKEHGHSIRLFSDLLYGRQLLIFAAVFCLVQGLQAGNLKAEDELKVSPKSAVLGGKTANAKDQTQFNKLRSALRQQKSLCFEFQSQLINKAGQVVNQQKGRVYFAAGKFRLDSEVINGFKNPTTSTLTVVYDGSKTYRYSSRDRKVTVLDKQFYQNLPVAPLLKLLTEKPDSKALVAKKAAISEGSSNFGFHGKAVGVGSENVELSFVAGKLTASNWYLAKPGDAENYVIWRNVKYVQQNIDKIDPTLFQWQEKKIRRDGVKKD